LTRTEEFESLLEKSRRFFETASIQSGRGFNDLAAFSLEQSLQLYLKAYLLKAGVDYPRTHSVRKLLELLAETTDSNEIRRLVSKYAVELGSLEDAYITSRYMTRQYFQEEVDRLRAVVEEVMQVVERVIG
jgi:HEPN domain-containing protein